ncbi:TetR/AcrR family transcriptional regulator [Kitasatospora purpeofusca]|uniref:TetR/AcrR family transcriptional regulator n=1 Tax=Kitasatospora purpeofusca TaxID=67352 RepID=UPI0035DC7C17
MPPITPVDGRRIGRRGLETRRRILTTTAEILAVTGAADTKVIDMARAAGTSPATFYQYFADRDAVVLALAVEAARRTARAVTATADGATGSAEALDQALTTCFEVWRAHGPVLRTVEVLAATNPDFRKIRRRIRKPLADAIKCSPSPTPVELLNVVLAMVSATAADNPTPKARAAVLNVALKAIGG